MVFCVLDRLGALAHADGELTRRCGRSTAGATACRSAKGARCSSPSASRRASRTAGSSGFGIARDTTATISDWGNGRRAGRRRRCARRSTTRSIDARRHRRDLRVGERNEARRPLGDPRDPAAVRRRRSAGRGDEGLFRRVRGRRRIAARRGVAGDARSEAARIVRIRGSGSGDAIHAGARIAAGETAATSSSTRSRPAAASSARSSRGSAHESRSRSSRR